MNPIKNLKTLILDILFPPLCLNCRTHMEKEEIKTGMCWKCLNGIVLNSSFFCPICKARLPDGIKTCHKDSKYLLAAAANYNNDAVKNIIWHFKYRGWQKLQNILGNFLTGYLQTLNTNFEAFIIVPVPLHKNKQRKRGFNQAEILGKIAAEHLNIVMEARCLKRIKNTATQAELKNHELRKKNVANCFFVENPDLIRDKNILLIDDVFTSGSTINEAVNVLRANGAKKIIAFVAAKAS
ncbi:MAG: ComF family protein [Candidatus Pacebacteria bacterium]|nr:ComF family protein [Candidatus Paceibacterota bacterium]